MSWRVANGALIQRTHLARRPLPPRQPQNAAATFNGGSGGGGGGKKPTGGFKTGGAAGEHETQGADKGEDLWVRF